jgi:hypothetical protein
MATNEEFLSTIKEGCIQGWREHAVLASISGAQAILESNWGKSTLALQANNLFGIKGDYNGASLTVETKEFINKVFKIVEATFRKYPSWSESITDHSAFFTSTEWRKTNYAAVVGETDYKKAAAALSAAGYATDPDYPAKLIKLIEAYGLDAWDLIEEETTMSYTINDRRSSALGGQSKDRSLSSITTIGWHYSAVMRSVRKFITGHEAYWRDTLGWDRGGYHFYIDADGNIWQNYDYERITWGVYNNNGYVVHISVEAGNGDDYSPAQVAAREWLTRKIMADLNIPASNVKGHNEIYNNSSCPGYTKAQMDAFRAKLAQPATAAVASNRLSVSYERMVASAGYSIDSKPWGEAGTAYWGKTDDYLGKVVQVTEENGSGEYANTSLGWIDKKALIDVPVRVPANYDATITSGGYSIDSKPWGEPGVENWGSTDAQLNKAFYFYEENASGEYANGVGLGWVDKRALTKGVLVPTVEPQQPVEEIKAEEPAKESEKVVSASILFLPNGKNWTVYPENGPYTAGDVISLEGPKEAGGLSFRILGDKGNNIVVVDLPNFGVVGLYFDADKGAVITQTYA